MGRSEWLNFRPDHPQRGHQKIHGHTIKPSVVVVLHAKLPIHHHLQRFSQPTTANMSEGEVEVATSSYDVLPKEVLAEVGSVKLFSTYSRRITHVQSKIDASAAEPLAETKALT